MKALLAIFIALTAFSAHAQPEYPDQFIGCSSPDYTASVTPDVLFIFADTDIMMEGEELNSFNLPHLQEVHVQDFHFKDKANNQIATWKILSKSPEKVVAQGNRCADDGSNFDVIEYSLETSFEWNNQSKNVPLTCRLARLAAKCP